MSTELIGAHPTKDERTWAMLAHLSGLFFSFLGPLVVWLVQKDQMPFVSDQSKEALNFQITLLIAWVAIPILMGFAGVIGAMISAFALILVPLVWLALLAVAAYALVQIIIATVKANDGIEYRYPIALRLIK